MVAGAVALIKNLYPNLTGAQIKQSILGGAFLRPSLVGKMVTSGSLYLPNALAVAATLGVGATPTPSPTATTSPTITPTQSPTATPSQTASPTASATPTVTPSQTQTPTPSPSPSPTQSATATPTLSATATPTPATTATAAPTVTTTPTVTSTPSPSSSSTPSPTVTPSPSAQPSPSPTPDIPTPSPTGDSLTEAKILAQGYIASIRVGIKSAQSIKPKKANNGKKMIKTGIAGVQLLVQSQSLTKEIGESISKQLDALAKAMKKNDWIAASKVTKQLESAVR